MFAGRIAPTPPEHSLLRVAEITEMHVSAGSLFNGFFRDPPLYNQVSMLVGLATRGSHSSSSPLNSR